ncbi:MAG: HD domain-containing phosphohydrolase [Sulfuricurvum sp.]|uniref:HD-GYP domain-containing protein n=1 Tax=Sulfuricurvum sp. TaxID=2025608 RepID=UPI00356AA177
MHRVVRRVINHKYTQIKPEILQKDTIIDFDCFIKRFDDYVIIIEAGSAITGSLVKKIQQHKVIYVLKHDMEKVNVYTTLYFKGEDDYLNITGEEIIVYALKLSETVSDISTVEKRLETVYKTTSDLMRYIFERSNDQMPIDALKTCVTEIIRSVDVPINILPLLLDILPQYYTTYHHSVNVAFFAAIIGKYSDIPNEKLKNLAYAGLLHDIGKMHIDPILLAKPEQLDENEYKIIKRHSQMGYTILEMNKIDDKDIVGGILFHHEKLDGTGYPQGLRGKVIPKFARIIGMCDVFDALTTHRTYRQNYSSYEALLLIKQEMREQFDEVYTDTFIRLLSKS